MCDGAFFSWTLMMFGAKLLGYLGMGMGARAGTPMFKKKNTILSLKLRL